MAELVALALLVAAAAFGTVVFFHGVVTFFAGRLGAGPQTSASATPTSTATQETTTPPGQSPAFENNMAVQTEVSSSPPVRQTPKIVEPDPEPDEVAYEIGVVRFANDEVRLVPNLIIKLVVEHSTVWFHTEE